MKYAIPILFLLSSCATLENGNPEDQRNIDILGKWVSYDANECWNPVIEYSRDKTKMVKLSYCDENGNIAREWYESEWKIEGSTIIETTIAGSEGIISGYVLPHVEADSLDYVDANKLVITDSRETSIYVRPKQ